MDTKWKTLPKKSDRDRTRTCNPQIRSLVPYPLGHTTTVSEIGKTCCRVFSDLQARLQVSVYSVLAPAGLSVTHLTQINMFTFTLNEMSRDFSQPGSVV